MADEGALRFTDMIFPGLPNELEDCFGDGSSGDACRGGFSTPERDVIKLAAEQTTTPSQINAVHPNAAGAVGHRQLRKQTAECLHVTGWILIARVVMPAVNKNHD